MPRDESLLKIIGKKINKYTITKYISSGGYGDVYEIIDKDEKKFAIKMPNLNKNSQSSILSEYKIYKSLSSKENGLINVKLTKSGEHAYMIMDLLGPSVGKFLKKYKTFNLQTVTLLTIQMIKILKYIHSRGYIHRDIKGYNFSIDRVDPNKIFCIDFGMAIKYIDKGGNHLHQETVNSFCGTEMYASTSAHNYTSQSRRDDLESLFYTIVTMYTGSLPWSNLAEKDKKRRLEKIGEMKNSIDVDELCKHMPKEYSILYKYIRNLGYYDKPHYTSLISMFERLKYDFNDEDLQWKKIE